MAFEQVISMIRARVTERNLPHAWLVSGASGEMRNAFSISFAKAFFEGDPEAARRIDAGVHEDLIRIQKDGESIKTEQISSLSIVMKNKPFVSEGIMAIIEDGEAMTEEAQNKLLKTLEEPNPGNLLLILCQNPKELRETIRSRCVSLRLDGNVACGESTDYEQAKNVISAVLFDRSRPLWQVFEMLEGYTEDRERASALLASMECFLRDLVVGGYVPALILNEPTRSILEKTGRKWERQFQKYVTIIEEARRDLNRRMNRRSCLRRMAIKFRQEALHG